MSFATPEDREAFDAWVLETQARSRAAYVTRYVDTTLGRVAAHIINPGERRQTLVCLAGWRTASMTFDVGDTLADLAQNFRVILLDLPGQPGWSTGRAPLPVGAGYAKWLGQALDGLEVSRASFLVSSFGALVLLKFVAVAPSRVERAVLLSPAAFVRLRYDTGLLSWGMGVTFPTKERVSALVRERWLGSGQRLEPERLALLERGYQLIMRSFRVKAVPPGVLYDRALRALTCPTLVLVGQEDTLFSAPKLIARVTTLPGLVAAEVLGGHGHALEVSPEVFARVSWFLERGL